MNEKFFKLGKNCLRLVTSEIESASFLGGKPLVSSSINWPRKNDKPLGFIAQLDLSEINNEQAIEWLPNSGRLLFFYDFYEWPWGFAPEDRGGWAILYENGSEELHFQELPSDLHKEHIASSIKYVVSEKFMSYPDGQRINFEEGELSEIDKEQYYDFIDEYYRNKTLHQIGGYPRPIQNDDMEKECQLISSGINYAYPEDYNSEEAKQLREQVNDWRLVFQFDSDDDIDVMWGDMGMLYFWVKESESKNCNFSNSWMILQCC
ncbi:sll5081 (plasmid) [Synechocystis sp. PCC 6803]|jgi:uncharacterized protein YwqG|uniref:Sll5081 protein n=1 Tax=Synechocystis sp. (strain ATCC 27184 / PCC 6803 / Kazusa) TaxID=1111708 RepID=Q6ZEP9_SYNY3|nr:MULTISPECIES: YwqG family protein [unclassified Synechocystis]AGF53508.1 hypothetical protein MYO_2820 [Synechocystis sp. PCC 6803]AVP91628.1 DUF1963 domain-containing protein [Synechocystis sp. IPPAS B-1465]MBD2619906.1 DUF1963 domain-containing protein [Synechocystis sp. FACHB-898]MBD2640803.1 DUF1963 domain-containing protein [Synechocystis sp. FACHB-908]MBD2662705.1 DUF1963 domain-containing protein [Synechocystis sp. FACHB-929]